MNLALKFDNQMVPESSPFVLESVLVGSTFEESNLTTAMFSYEAKCNRKRRDSCIFDANVAVI